MKKRIQSVLSKPFLGALLIGGTALGAAMLANPVATAGAGILPSYFVYLLCWLFSTATGCLFVELSSWLPKGSNLMTMAETFLGKIGKWAVLLVYIFQFYLLMIAYVSLGGQIVIDAICSHIPYAYGVGAYILLFGSFICFGTKLSSKLNAILMAGLVFSLIIFILLSGETASLERANYWGWKYAFIGLPVIFTSFSYQGTIPTLYNYLDQDAKKTRLAVIFGTLIPFASYLIWDYLIKGIVPTAGVHGLIEAKQMGQSAIEPLQYAVKDRTIYYMGKLFAFFALTTSFIGVALAMIDFFADFFHVKSRKWNRLYISLCIFIPVAAVVVTNPGIFIKALSLAGGFGAATLLGLLPIVLVWLGRRDHKYAAKEKYLLGGNGMLYLLLLAIVLEIGVSVCVLL